MEVIGVGCHAKIIKCKAPMRNTSHGETFFHPLRWGNVFGNAKTQAITYP